MLAKVIRSDNSSIDKSPIITGGNIAASTTLLHCNISEHEIAIFALHARTGNRQRCWRAI